MIAAALALLCAQEAPQPPSREELIATATRQLVAIQEGGEWPYEGVYRVRGEIPVGYRAAGTSIVATTLVRAAPEDPEARAAVDRGLGAVLELLEHPLMAPSAADAYDVRVWGHAYALAFLCELDAAERLGERAQAARAWMPKLVAALGVEELENGGWNYATRSQPAGFVTASVVQALLAARARDVAVPDALFERARDVLLRARHGDGAFVYYGGSKEPGGLGMSGTAMNSLAGSAGRTAACEGTLHLLGASSLDLVRQSALAFFDHWDDLAARRKQKGTHEGPYKIAPYYFYYAHAYTAQAIELLPEKARDELRARMLETLLRTRDEDGTWDDRVFPRTRNYGTAMAVLVLLMDRAPRPPAWKPVQERGAGPEPAGGK